MTSYYNPNMGLSSPYAASGSNGYTNFDSTYGYGGGPEMTPGSGQFGNPLYLGQPSNGSTGFPSQPQSGIGGVPQNAGGSVPQSGGYPQSSGFGFSSGGAPNPYLGQQADALRNQYVQANGDMNNQITSGAIAAGGLGGSRQGVAQGVSQARSQTGLDSALAGLYGNAYAGDQNRALSQYQGDQGFYTQQRGQDLQQAGLGASLYGMGTQGEWSPYQNFGNILNGFSGNGTTSSSQGGGGLGFLGGALGGAQLGKNMGWWG